MSSMKRWSKMTCLVVLAILLSIFIGAGSAEGTNEPVQVTISGSHWIQAGSGTTIHVDGLDQAPDWYYKLLDMTTGEQIDYVRKQEGTAAPGDISYAGSMFQADHQYCFQTWSSPAYSYLYFYVYDETDSNISISIDGGQEGILINKYYDLRITAPGARLIAWRDLNQADYWNYDNGTDARTGTSITNTDWNEGTHTIVAKAYYGEIGEDFPGYDNLDWGPVCTIPLTFDPISYGPAPIPTLHVNQDSYTRGEFATVSVEADLTKIDRFDLYVRRTDSPDDYSCGGWRSTDGPIDEISFYTANLPTGEYKLFIQSEGEGYENNQAYLDEETFTVTEAPAGSVTLRASSEDVLYYDSFRYSCYAPGASAVTIYRVYSYDVYAIASGESYACSSDTMYSSDAILYAVAEWNDGTRTESERVTVHPILYGNLEADVTVPKLIQQGQDTTVSLTGMEKANYSWDYTVYDQTTGERIMYRYGYGKAAPESITISGDDLKANHNYYISVDAQGKGYNNFSKTKYFYVYDGEPDPNITFSIDEGPVPDEIYINKTYEMTISAEGATAIAWLDDNWGAWQYEILDANENSIRRDIRVSGKGKYSIIAKACYDPISGNPGYEEINWSTPGAAMLDCDVISKGPATFTLSEIPTTNPAGKDITVHWAPQYENQRLSRTFSCPGVNMGWGENEYQERDMLFDGYRMDTPGSYKMVFRSSADCYENYEEEYEITVVANDQRPTAPIPSIKGSKVYTGMDFYLCFEDVQEAVYVEIRNADGDHVTNGSDRNLDKIRFSLPEEGTYDVYLYASVDGVWSEWTKALTITVEDLPIDVEVPETWMAGQDLSMHWTPAVEGQTLSLSIYNTDSDEWYYPSNSSLSDEGDIAAEGCYLEPGNYRLQFSSGVDSFGGTTKTYPLTVTENSQRPAAPTLTVKDTTIYEDISFKTQLDKQWEGILLEVWTTGEDAQYYSRETAQNTDTIFQCISTPGTYDLYVSGAADHVWSVKSKAATITVEPIPTVSEITLLLPEQITIGEDLQVTAFLPEAENEIWIRILNADGNEIYNYGSAWTYNHYANNTFSGLSLVNNNIEPGTVTAEITVRPNGMEPLEKKTGTVRVAGEKPEPLTAKADSIIGETGTPIRISGETGSADRIQVKYQVESQGRWYYYSSQSSISEGNWTAEIATPKSGKYYVTVTGYNGALATGSKSMELIVAGEDSLPAPTISTMVNPNNSGEAIIHFDAPDVPEDEDEIYWQYWWTTEDGDAYSNSSFWRDAGEDYDSSTYFNFKNTYVLTVVYQIDSVWSAPATATVTITEGRPWPIYGKLPIDADVPQTWPAGKDLNIHWTPAAEGQRAWANVYTDDGNGISMDVSSLNAEGDFIAPGYSLEPGSYRVEIGSELDYWENTNKTYRLTITENTERPDAPEATVNGKSFYKEVYFDVLFDQVYEGVAVEFRTTGERPYRYTSLYGNNTDRVSTDIYEPNTYDVYVSKSEDHVWSVKRKAGRITIQEIPDVTEISIIAPEQITIGQDLRVAALLPEDTERIGLRLLKANGETLYEYGTTWIDDDEQVCSWSISAVSLLNGGIQPGTITVEVRPYDSDYNPGDAVTKTVQVTGTVPERPTIDAAPRTAEKGTPITLQGSAGSADRIAVVCYVESGNNGGTYSTKATIDGDRWTAEIATPKSGRYSITITGYKGALVTGSKSVGVIVTGEDSLAAPTISATENPDYSREAIIHFDAPDAPEDEDEIYWRYWWTTEDGEDYSSNDFWMDAGEDYDGTTYFNYRNTYVLTAVYRIDSVWSAPATATVTITEGKPWPIYGKLPIDADVPQTWPAGKDLNIHWTPAAEGQRAWANVYTDDGNWISMGVSSLNAEGDFIALGYSLEPGSYRLEIGSELDYWENTYKTYRLTVTENTERPDAPEATVSGESFYKEMYFDVLFDQVYEGVAVEFWTTGERPYRYTSLYGSNTDRVSTDIYEPNTYDVYVSKSEDHVWSAKRKAGRITIQEIPDVTEISIIAPEQITIGQDLRIAALLPDGTERIGLQILKANGAVLYSYGTRWIDDDEKVCSWSISAISLLNNGIQPGTITVEVRPYDSDYNQGEAVTETVQVTGTVPEKPTLDDVTKITEKGTPITLQGSVGSADRIAVVCDIESGEDGNRYSVKAMVDGDRWTAEIPTLIAGKYSITVSGYKGGLVTGGVTKTVHVTGESSLPAPTVSIALERPNSTYARLQFTTPDSKEEIRWHYWITAEDGSILWENNNWTQPGFDLQTGYGFTFANTYTLTVLYAIDSVWSNPATATVTVTGGRPWPVNGPLPINPEIPETAPAGEDLVIHWTPGIAGQEIRLNVYNQQDERYVSVENNYLGKEGDMILSGADLEPGDYRLSFTSTLDTWEDTSKEYFLTIVENDKRPETGNVTVTPDAVTTLTEVTLNLDKTYSKISVTLTNSYGYRSTQTAKNTNKVSLSSGRFGIGENQITVKTCTDGVWSLPKTVTVMVTEAPTLSEPQIIMDNTLQVGRPLQVTISCDEHAERMEIQAWMETETYSTTYYKEIKLKGNQVTLTLPEDVFQPGDATIWVYTSGSGYYSAEAYATVAITGQRPDVPTVSFDRMSGNAGETIYATIRTKGVVEISEISEYSDETKYYSPNNGVCVIPLELDFYGETDYRFRTKVNGIWSGWTDAYTLTTEEPPEVTEPANGFVIFPETIEPGEDVQVTFKKVEGAQRYYLDLQVYSGEGGYSGYLYGEELSEPGTITIPAKYFYNGGAIGFSAEAGLKYRSYSSHSYVWAGKEYTVQPINDESWSALAITVDKTQALPEEPITVTLQDVQADEIIVTEVFEDGTESNYSTLYDWDGNKISRFTVSGYNTGVFRFKVRAKINGMWTKETDIFPIQINPFEEEALDNPVITTIPAESMKGSPVTLQWEAVEGAEYYEVIWHRTNGYWHSARVEGSTSYTIDANDLDTTGIYRVYVTSHAANRPSEWAKIYNSMLTVVNPYEGETLSLPNGLTEIETEAFAGTRAEIIVIPASCTKIGSKAFANCESLTVVRFQGRNTVIAEDAFEGCGSFTVIAPEGSQTAQNLVDIGFIPEYEY